MGGGFELADGRHQTIGPGDWLITRAKQIIDVIADRQLRERYQVIDAGAITLPLATCEQLDTTLGLGATQTPERLVAAVERLASLSIGEVKIDFTPGQWTEIATRAKKRNQTIPQAVQAVVDRIKEEIFWRS